jgi:hypothetical protein
MLTVGAAQYLLTRSAVTDIVGDSIQPIPAPVKKELYPCITYQSPSDVPSDTGDQPDGISTARVVYDCLISYGPGSYIAAYALALAVKNAFNGYSGTLPDGTRVFRTKVVNMTDNFGNDAQLSRRSVHVVFTYSD